MHLCASTNNSYMLEHLMKTHAAAVLRTGEGVVVVLMLLVLIG
jgi:hypothetical protein